MRRSLVELHVHLVWATWDRLACLDPGICERVHAAIAAKATALGCQRVTVGGVADHVHVLLTLPATLAVADLVKHLKGEFQPFHQCDWGHARAVSLARQLCGPERQFGGSRNRAGILGKPGSASSTG